MPRAMAAAIRSSNWECSLRRHNARRFGSPLRAARRRVPAARERSRSVPLGSMATGIRRYGETSASRRRRFARRAASGLRAGGPIDALAPCRAGRKPRTGQRQQNSRGVADVRRRARAHRSDSSRRRRRPRPACVACADDRAANPGRRSSSRRAISSADSCDCIDGMDGNDSSFAATCVSMIAGVGRIGPDCFRRRSLHSSVAACASIRQPGCGWRAPCFAPTGSSKSTNLHRAAPRPAGIRRRERRSA